MRPWRQRDIPGNSMCHQDRSDPDSARTAPDQEISNTSNLDRLAMPQARPGKSIPLGYTLGYALGYTLGYTLGHALGYVTLGYTLG